MSPRLEAISGPLQGMCVPLAETVSIGREPSNQLCLDDASVAPSHCQIASDLERSTITDFGSRAGTFVNGIPVKQRVLADGDNIAIGNSVFLFTAGNAAESSGSGVELDEGSSISLSAQQLRQDEVLYLHPEALAALPSGARLARDLSTLLKISAGIGSIRNVESLQWQLLGMIFDVIPAERGAILLVDDREAFTSPVGWDRVSGPDHPVHVGHALARRVIEGRISILDNQVPAGVTEPDRASGPGTHPQKASASVDGLGGGPRPAGRQTDFCVRSLVCVPLVVSEKALGLVYLDTGSAVTSFTKDDLQLLTAIAGIAAIAIENARQIEQLGSENRRLRAEVGLEHDMIGESPRMREVYQFIERVAPSDSTVLICGESGTGKELAARAIHQNSRRRDEPFVAMNCAALTETLLESELFGHERGAFTGAVSQKKGQLETAEGGTVFLDEVGELPLALQAKLLRVLQERECVRVGGTRTIKLDVRFVAATNQDLQRSVREGRFRSDLYYRLNVVSLRMPALREHPEDIMLLADTFAARYGEKCNRRVKEISPEAGACLRQYDWPGNIRELENALERAIVLGSSEMILPEDLPETVLEAAPASPEPAGKYSIPCSDAVSNYDAISPQAMRYHDALRALKKQLIIAAFEKSGASFTEAAKLLGVHPNYLHRLVRNLDLKMALKPTAKL